MNNVKYTYPTEGMPFATYQLTVTNFGNPDQLRCGLNAFPPLRDKGHTSYDTLPSLLPGVSGGKEWHRLILTGPIFRINVPDRG